ncbi:DoxX family protein [Actinomadura chibensis]|uniref:DoxX family protein n=1 Tax=Actinomadura chibensis TaxID=392828 RepID=A0A5D0NN65_9ACTN|nr:DoxX family protein [Actinomadura chibensis]TYB45679.1 DoxX family protein [Actinomadura chibensis]
MAATQTPATVQSPAAAPERTASPRGRARSRVLWGAQIALAVFMVVASGLPKLFGEHTAVQLFEDIGWGQWFRYFTGAVEIAGGLGLLIPRLSAAAATGLVGVMIGAVITNIGLGSPEVAPFPALLGVVFAVIAWNRREKARDLLDLFRR